MASVSVVILLFRTVDRTFWKNINLKVSAILFGFLGYNESPQFYVYKSLLTKYLQKFALLLFWNWLLVTVVLHLKAVPSLIPANICLGEDVLKTSWKTSWRCLENVLKTFYEDILQMRLEDVFKASSRRLERRKVLRWRRLQDVCLGKQKMFAGMLVQIC